MSVAAKLNKKMEGQLVVDFKQFNRAANLLIKALAKESTEFIDLFDGLVLQLFNSMAVGDPRFGSKGTPVDTGFARSSWTINESKPFGETSGPVSPAFSATPKLSGGTRSYTITNGAGYIIFLEFGSSDQAPEGFVRISVRGFTKEMEKKGKEILRKRR